MPAVTNTLTIRRGYSLPDIIIRRGDVFALTLTLVGSESQDVYPIQSVNIPSRQFTVSGLTATPFATGAMVRCIGNNQSSANKTYTTTTAVQDSGQNITVVTVASNVTASVSTANASANSFTVASNVLSSFPRGMQFYMVSNSTAAANKQYTVDYAYLNAAGTSTTIFVRDDVPSGVANNGTLTIPTIPWGTDVSGGLRAVNDTPIDLAGYTITAEIRDAPHDGTLIDSFTVTKPDSSGGVFRLGLTDTETNALENGVYYFDIKLDDATNPPIRFPYSGAGYVRVLDPVTA